MATVEDDGTGFDVERVMEVHDAQRGLGLFGMRERASYVGGRVEITSEVGTGTVVRAAVPARGPGAPMTDDVLSGANAGDPTGD